MLLKSMWTREIRDSRSHVFVCLSFNKPYMPSRLFAKFEKASFVISRALEQACSSTRRLCRNKKIIDFSSCHPGLDPGSKPLPSCIYNGFRVGARNDKLSKHTEIIHYCNYDTASSSRDRRTSLCGIFNRPIIFRALFSDETINHLRL